MVLIEQRITIVHLRKPDHQSINDELQWVGSSLGLFNQRDKDKSCFRIFIELLKSAKQNDKRCEGLSSEEVASRLALTRATVIHHLNRLQESGIVVHQRKRYLLRMNRLEFLIDELRKDVDRTCDDLREAAREIDERLGL